MSTLDLLIWYAFIISREYIEQRILASNIDPYVGIIDF